MHRQGPFPALTNPTMPFQVDVQRLRSAAATTYRQQSLSPPHRDIGALERQLPEPAGQGKPVFTVVTRQTATKQWVVAQIQYLQGQVCKLLCARGRHGAGQVGARCTQGLSTPLARSAAGQAALATGSRLGVFRPLLWSARRQARRWAAASRGFQGSRVLPGLVVRVRAGRLHDP